MSGKILVIDDEKSLRFTFESFLAGEGYATATATNHDEALALLDQEDFDVIFSDILLGGKTGIDLLRVLKERQRSCPVIMVTGFPNLQTATEAVRLGAFDYLAKPVLKKDLLQVARSALKYKELLDQNEKYHANLDAVFRSVKDGIVTVDEQGRILALNEAAGRICDLPADAQGRPFASATPGCSGRCRGALFETLRQRQPLEVPRQECGHHGRPGQLVTLTTSPLLNRKGDFSGAVLVLRDETRLNELERSLKKRQRLHNLVGGSEKMQSVYGLVEDLADVPTTALIFGESGTGKELVAEALHVLGRFRNKPLVKVNCAALPDTLLESELFGHVRGAFTGAVRDKAGRFQKADGGTIFLDEIGDISPRMQLRLLRVLQEKEVERVGESTPTKVEVRVVAATNQNLAEKVRRGEFREDLYYRLKVVTVDLPPLRERMDDIPLLVDHFIDKFNKGLNKAVSGLSEDVERLFGQYPWPGNVRELQHALEHAFVRCHQSIITLDHLPDDIRSSGNSSSPAPSDEPQMIRKALRKTDGNKAKAARLLGMDRKTLYRKIERYRIATEAL